MVEDTDTDEWAFKALAQKCADVEQIVSEVVMNCRKWEKSKKEERDNHSQKARLLITERKQVRMGGVVEQGRTVKQISKDLQRELRAWDRIQKRIRIAEILDDFKGLQKIAFIKNNEKKDRLTSIKGSDGGHQTG